MTDCIRSLLINCSHLKELFIINLFFLIITTAFLRFFLYFIGSSG